MPNKAFAVVADVRKWLRVNANALSWLVLLPVLAIITWEFAASLQKWAGRTVFDADAIATYLPFAKRLLNEGWPFLLTETATHVPPLSYMIPALFGADLAVQKQVGIVLSTLVIPLLFRAGWVLHSRTAGLAAVALYAGSRLFKNFLPTAGVEPLFIFFSAVWLWGLAEGWARQRKWAFVFAGVALGLAALTRATIIYYFPLVLGAAWWLSRQAGTDQPKWRAVFFAHLIGFALVMPVLIKNLAMFGMPAVSTGAGIALFFGSSPLTYGLDQNYFTVGLDITSIIPPGASHLDVTSDRRLLAVAKHILLTQDPWLTVKMCLIKLHAFLFLSEREWFGVVSEFRSYRILLFAFCWPLVVRLRAIPVAGLVFGLLAYQTAVHVPVLYSMRYSVAAIDLGLCFLAALGFAELIARCRWLALAATLLIVWLAGLAMKPDGSHPPYPELNLEAVQSRTVVSWRPEEFRISPTGNSTQLSPGLFEVGTGGEADIDFDFTGVPELLKLTSHVATFNATVVSPRTVHGCNSKVLYFYRKLRQVDFTAERAVYGYWYRDDKPHRYFVGGYLNLELYEPGTFRIRLSCEPGTRVRIDDFKVVEPNTGASYRDSYFKSRGWTSWPAGF